MKFLRVLKMSFGGDFCFVGTGLSVVLVLSILLWSTPSRCQLREVAQSQQTPRELLLGLQAILDGEKFERCSIDTVGDREGDMLSITCRLPDFRVGGFCNTDVGGKTFTELNQSVRQVLFDLLQASPTGRVLDFEVEIIGWSDGLDFQKQDSALNFACGGYDDQIDTWLSERKVDLHHRLGLYRGFLIWSELLRTAENLSMPLGTPKLDESVLGKSPGRVMLRSRRTTQVGSEFRKVEVKVTIHPRLFLRCAGNTRPMLSDGIQICVPICQTGHHLREVGGVLSCVPRCKQNEMLEVDDRGQLGCKPIQCIESGNVVVQKEADARPAMALWVDQGVMGLSGMSYPARALAGLIVSGRLLEVYTVGGMVTDSVDQSWGLAVAAGVRFRISETVPLFPRLDVSFSNLSKHWGDDSWEPKWLVSVEPGVDWEFLRKESFGMALSLTIPVGLEISDELYGDGAAVRSKTNTGFVLGGRLGLRFIF